MFNQIDFERKFYALVTQEVNKVFSELVRNRKDSVQQEGLKIQRKIMELLHAITEETAIQIFYGLLVSKEGEQQ
jgi:hypothetical protein